MRRGRASRLIGFDTTDFINGSQSGTGDESQTRGPNKVYAVTLPPMKGVTAEVNFTNKVTGSLYLADACGDIEGTCQNGATGSTDEATRETLTFSNRTDSKVTRYLVVDTAADQLFDTASLSLSFNDVICTPGMTQCNGTAVETCAPAGTRYLTELAHLRVRLRPSFSLEMGSFTDDYNIGGAACIGSSNSSPGHDAVFEFQADAGEIAQLTWDPPEEPTLYVVSDCTDVAGSCIVGTSSGIYGTSTLTGQFEGAGASTLAAPDLDGGTPVQ